MSDGRARGGYVGNGTRGTGDAVRSSASTTGSRVRLDGVRGHGPRNGTATAQPLRPVCWTWLRRCRRHFPLPYCCCRPIGRGHCPIGHNEYPGTLVRAALSSRRPRPRVCADHGRRRRFAARRHRATARGGDVHPVRPRSTRAPSTAEQGRAGQDDGDRAASGTDVPGGGRAGRTRQGRAGTYLGRGGGAARGAVRAGDRAYPVPSPHTGLSGGSGGTVGCQITRARSSAVERCPYKADVGGSKPSAPTRAKAPSRSWLGAFDIRI